MNSLKFLYNSIIGKHILLEDKSKYYNEKTLPLFKTSKDRCLFYDDSANDVLLLTFDEMKERFQKGDYRNYDGINTFEDFCLFSCVEVLKEFSDFSIEEVISELLNHNILKYCFR